MVAGAGGGGGPVEVGCWMYGRRGLSFVAVQVRAPGPGAGVVRVRGAVDGDLLRQVLAAAEGAC